MDATKIAIIGIVVGIVGLAGGGFPAPDTPRPLLSRIIDSETSSRMNARQMGKNDQQGRQIKDIEKKQSELAERVAKLEGRNDAPKQEGWLKRNQYRLSLAVALGAFVLGSGAVLKFF